jgi:hypothetical protein
LVSTLRVACRVLSFVTTGLDPVVHAETELLKRRGEAGATGLAAWIAGSSPAMTQIIGSRSRDAIAPELCQAITKSVGRMEPTGPAFGRPDDRLRAIRATTLRKKKGKRNAGRRTSMSRIERMRPRVQRDALACRRSTTALAAATERHRSAPANALPRTGLDRSGRYPLPAVPVQRVAPQTGHNAGRAYYPGAARERR